MLEKFEITASAVKDYLHSGDPLQLVELCHRQKHEWSLFKARGALRVADDALEQHLSEIPHNRPVVIFSECPGDDVSDRAAQLLLKQGWKDVHKLVGGFDAYLNAGLPVESVTKAIPATKIMLL